MQCPRLNLTTSVTPRAGRSLGRADMQPAGSKGIPVGEGVGGVGEEDVTHTTTPLHETGGRTQG